MEINHNIIWKDAIGYEGMIVVSNTGLIKRLHRVIVTSSGRNFTIKEKILSGNIDKDGYIKVCLNKNNKKKTIISHRMIAMTFIPNPDNKPCVNHKNGIKNDNRVENLEWNTVLENNIHAYETKLKVMPKGKDSHMFGKIGKDNYKSKKIIQFDLNGNLVCKYDSLSEAVTKNNYKGSPNITSNLYGKSKHAYGYVWKFNTEAVNV